MFKFRKERTRSIKNQMIVSFGAFFIGITLIFSFKFYSEAKNSSVNNTMNMMNQLSVQSSSLVMSKLNQQLTMGQGVASDSRMIDSNIAIDDKNKALNEDLEMYGHKTIGLVDTTGKKINSTGKVTDVSKKDTFKKNMNGEITISDPFPSSIDGKMIMTYSIPIKDKSGNVVSIVEYVRLATEISEILNDVKFLDTGSAYMLNSEGTIIAHQSQELVDKSYNKLKEDKDKAEIKELLDIESKMINGETGIGTYTYEGKKMAIAYRPVGINGWSIGVTVEYDDILQSVDTIKKTAMFLTIITIILGILITFLLSNRLAKSIERVTEKVKLISSGDFTIEIDKDLLSRKDEIGAISKSLEKLKESLSNMILKIKGIADEVDNKTMSLSAFSQELASSTNNITVAIGEVANGNTEQVSGLNNINIIIDNFSNKIDKSVLSINNINNKAIKIGKNTSESKRIALKMDDSVNKFDEMFNEFNDNILTLGEDMNTVSSITNLIKGISDRTNLLALNAAIEAARAGEMGKGFAVVADEIRSLADQSKSSSEEINKIINKSCENTNNIVLKTKDINGELTTQKENIKEVLNVFDDIVQSVESVIPELNDTYKEFNKIKENKDEIVKEVEEISAISQEIAASSEEISASSNELNSASEEVAIAAQNLSGKTRDIIEEFNKFKLK